jgi:hypothetical protein
MALEVLSDGQPAGSASGSMIFTLEQGTIKPATEKTEPAKPEPAEESKKD